MADKLGKSKSYGNKLGYSIFHFVLKHIGLQWAYGILFVLVPYYVIFRPGVYRRAKPYLERRFPEDGSFWRILRLFRYIFVFGQTLIDQFYFGFVENAIRTLEFDREAEILDLLERKPVIFLMSHVGFWEVSMAGAIKFDKTLNVMADEHFDKDKRKRFYDIQGKKFNLINVSEQYGGMIEATNALLRGEVVGVTGDRAEQWRSQTTLFLGSPARFPVIAQQLAATTGATIIALFTHPNRKKSGVRLYWKDISTQVLADDRLTKGEKVGRMLELYAEALEEYVRDNPYMWFNFFDFWKL